MWIGSLECMLVVDRSVLNRLVMNRCNLFIMILEGFLMGELELIGFVGSFIVSLAGFA